MKINISSVILLIALLVISSLYLNQCNHSSNIKDDLNISKMNEKVLGDSIEIYKTKNDDLVYEKGILIASKKELKDANNELYEEIKDLKNNPKIIIKEKIIIKHDTTKVNTDVIYNNDGNFKLSWKFDTLFSKGNFQRIHGITTFSLDTSGIFDPITLISTNEIGLSLITGLTEGKENYEIFIKSDYPGFNVTNIEGSIIDKKMIKSDESRFVIGPSIGYGILLSGGEVRYGAIIGLNATYNLNKSIKKIFKPYGL